MCACLNYCFGSPAYWSTLCITLELLDILVGTSTCAWAVVTRQWCIIRCTCAVVPARPKQQQHYRLQVVSHTVPTTDCTTRHTSPTRRVLVGIVVAKVHNENVVGRVQKVRHQGQCRQETHDDARHGHAVLGVEGNGNGVAIVTGLVSEAVATHAIVQCLCKRKACTGRARATRTNGISGSARAGLQIECTT